MTTITVYRVEHVSDGYGPYSHISKNKDWDARLYRMLRAHSSSDDTPSPYDKGEPFGIDSEARDFRSEYARQYVFGFLYEKDLREWFGTWLPDLLEMGFAIVQYQVKEEDILLGNRQIAFKKKKGSEDAQEKPQEPHQPYCLPLGTRYQ